MYQSTDIHGNAIPVTGVLLVPRAPWQGPRPLIAFMPATRGLGKQCAPSRFFAPATVDPRAIDAEAPLYYSYLARGFAVVITDYEGGGTPLPQSFFVGPPEGYAGLDAVRAAQRLDPRDALTPESPVGLSGYAQGGQAASWAAQLQPHYAPELNVKGVLAGAIPYDMDAQINQLNGNPTGAGVALGFLVGLDAAFPELKLDSTITPRGHAVINRVRHSCAIEELLTFDSISIGDVTQPDALKRSDVHKVLARSQLGATSPGVPAYIYYGSLDTIIPPHFDQQLYHDWCQRGADVQIEQLPGLEHVTTSLLGPWRGMQWLSQRLKGAQTPSGCHEVGLKLS